MFRPVSVIIRLLQFLLKGVTYLPKSRGDVEISPRDLGRYVTLFSKNCKNLMMTDTGRNI